MPGWRCGPIATLNVSISIQELSDCMGQGALTGDGSVSTGWQEPHSLLPQEQQVSTHKLSVQGNLADELQR